MGRLLQRELQRGIITLLWSIEDDSSKWELNGVSRECCEDPRRWHK